MIIDPYKWQRVTIDAVVRESQRAVSVRVVTDALYSFMSGEHAIVRITTVDGQKLMRQYSFASAPSSGEIWFTVVEETGGAVSTWFNQQASIGDSIEITQPFTGPLKQKLSDENICMIAGGSGIAPLMSYLRESRVSGSKQPITLLYSTRRDQDCFTEELLAKNDNETIVVRYTNEATRFNTDELRNVMKDADKVLICGSRPFALDMRTIAESIVDPSAVHAEAFSL